MRLPQAVWSASKNKSLASDSKISAITITNPSAIPSRSTHVCNAGAEAFPAREQDHVPQGRRPSKGPATARLMTALRQFRRGGISRQENMRLLLRVAIISIACLLSAAPAAAEPLPRTVLVLHQSIPYTEFFGKLFVSFQSTL